MRGYRSKLKVYKRRKADGTIFYTARGFIPSKRQDGSFARQRIELGIRGDTATARKAEVDGLNKHFEDKALNVGMTFARAYENYLDVGNQVPMFGEKLIFGLGDRQAVEIDDTVMLELVKTMFKPDAKPSYINRHLYTPVIAILNMALKQRAPELTRPIGHKAVTPLEIPDQDWFAKLFPHLKPDTRALLAFLTIHGRRLGDALGRRPGDFDPVERTLIVGKTKTGSPLLVELLPQVAGLIEAMPDYRSREWLFSCGPKSSGRVRADILVACCAAAGLPKPNQREKGWAARAKKACAGTGFPYFAPHSLGRHAFATRLLRKGFSLQYVKDAGGWATIEMVSERYGHLEKKEVTVAVHQVGNEFANMVDITHSFAERPGLKAGDVER